MYRIAGRTKKGWPPAPESGDWRRRARLAPCLPWPLYGYGCVLRGGSRAWLTRDRLASYLCVDSTTRDSPALWLLLDLVLHDRHGTLAVSQPTPNSTHGRGAPNSTHGRDAGEKCWESRPLRERQLKLRWPMAWRFWEQREELGREDSWPRPS